MERAIMPVADPTRGPMVRTYTGRAWYLLDPRPEDVYLPDLVVQCSHTPRYGGATTRMYTVLEHLVVGARQMLQHEYKGEVVLPGTHAASQVLLYLIHDLHEGVVHDIGRVMKALAIFEGYRAMEVKAATAVATALGLGPGDPGANPVVAAYDDAMAEAEMRHLQHPVGQQKWAQPTGHPVSTGCRFGHKAARPTYWQKEFALLWAALWPVGAPQASYLLPLNNTQEAVNG